MAYWYSQPQMSGNNSEINNQNHPKMAVAIYFLAMFLAFLLLMVLTTITEQNA